MEFTVYIVTGYSGAGKTTVLKSLEDSSFFCVDNLPIALLPAFFDTLHQNKHYNIALGIDVRNEGSLDSLMTMLSTIKEKVGDCKILFLAASTAQLVKRFQETRRKHPLAQDITLIDAIEQEKNLLRPLLDNAHAVIDTSTLTVHQIRNLVKESIGQRDTSTMIVHLMSFGFKYGVPRECNFVYDVRSLPNPYFVSELRNLTGVDEQIHTFLFQQHEVQEYWNRLHDFFTFTVNRSYDEGRFFMHVALGCTGGKHRSVAFVQELAKSRIKGVAFVVSHRDIGKERT